MQYTLAFIVLSILYLSINGQSATNSTILAVLQNVSAVEIMAVPITQHVTVNQTTMSSTMSTTTTTTITITTTPNVSHKAIGSSYVEPPPHPLGYCIRSPLRCSKIRRCCSGPCNVTRMKCP